jgi:hypothetical protein
MGIERYLGFHFTETCIYIAEAYVGRDNHLHWDVMEQANYELEPEWLPLFKDAIPNLYDNEGEVYGFAALPSIWSSLRYNRFLRFNLRFFEKAIKRKITDDDQRKLAGLFRYCQVYHIRPQPDETLVATVVTERLNSRERRILKTLLKQIASDARLEFADVIEPEEACLRYLWYESVHQKLNVESKMVLLIHLGYARTLMIPWDHCQAINQSARAPGMLEIDRGVAMYAGRMGMGKTVGEDELLLYAQRARRAFEPGQPSVKIVDAELESSVYLKIIKEQVSDITSRVERFLRDSAGRMNPVDEILLVGEGTAFSPVVEAMQMAHVDVPMRTLPQPTYAAARGAASKSWRAKNKDSEVR